MTCQKQAGEMVRAVVPFADGSAVRHRLNGAKGIVQTRTTEDPPRYFVLAEDEEGTFERIVRHHELEAFDTVIPERPSGTMVLPKGTLMTVPNFGPPPFSKAFDVYTRSGELLADLIKMDAALFSTPFGSPAHYPKPIDPRAVVKNDAANVPQIVEWRTNDFGRLIGVVGGVDRFSVVKVPPVFGDLCWSAQDGRELSPHFATQREAQDWCVMRTNPGATGVIYFSREGPDGKHLSDCRRFVVQRHGEQYQAHDTRDQKYSPCYGTLEDAFKWSLDRRRGRGTVNETTPKMEPTKLVSVPGLEWEEMHDAAFWLWSKCRRFRVNMHPSAGTDHHWSQDMRHTGEGSSMSPNGTLSDAKEWCEDRAAATAKPAEPVKPAGKLVWAGKLDAARYLCDSSNRFKIANTDAPGSLLLAIDTKADTSELRYGNYMPDLDAAKAWCEERSKFGVAKSSHTETLVPIEQIPF